MYAPFYWACRVKRHGEKTHSKADTVKLFAGFHSEHKWKKGLKDCVKKYLASYWEIVARDRSRWRKMVYSRSCCLQANIWAKTKRVASKVCSITPDSSQFAFQYCEWISLSNACLNSQNVLMITCVFAHIYIYNIFHFFVHCKDTCVNIISVVAPLCETIYGYISY